MNANDCLGFASRDCLRAVGSEWTVVTCTSGDATRELMSTASRFLMSLRLLEVVTGVSKDARSPKVPVDTRGCGCRELHAIRSNPGSPSQHGGERLRGQDESRQHGPQGCCRREACRVFRTRWEKGLGEQGLRSASVAREGGTGGSRSRERHK